MLVTTVSAVKGITIIIKTLIHLCIFGVLACGCVPSHVLPLLLKMVSGMLVFIG